MMVTERGLRAESDPMGLSAYTPHRSKLFTVSHSVNPLVAAAAPLHTLVTRILYQLHPMDKAETIECLSYEIKTFEQQSQRQHYPLKTILAARYLLCVWIDEVLMESPWGRRKHWQANTLSQHSQGDIKSDVDFFMILKRTMQEPNVHIDLLEMMYLFLALGYEGKYRHKERGHVVLSGMLDSLYKCISYHRGDQHRRLLPHTPSLHAATPRHSNRNALYIIILGTLLCLACAFVALNHELDTLSHPIFAALDDSVKSELSS